MSFEKAQRLVEGEVFNVGGHELTVPPLSLGSVKRLVPMFAIVQANPFNKGEDMERFIGAAVKIIHAAVKRNYPDVTEADIEDAVDMKVLPAMIAVVCGQSGIVSKAQAGEEGVPMGESSGGVSTAG